MSETTWGITVIAGEEIIRRIEPDGKMWWVPEAPGNRHYQEYLEWVAEGNEPEVIDG